jgi:hypothetical protein
MDAVSPTANAPKNVANGSGTPTVIHQQAEFIADECNRADVQHIPPRTVVNDRESTAAEETGNRPPENHQRSSEIVLPRRFNGKTDECDHNRQAHGGCKHEHHGVGESRQGSSRLML